MATCIRCGSDLLPSETQCGRCGTALAAPVRPTPLGVWASESLRPPEERARLAPVRGAGSAGAAGGRERTPVPGRERTPVPGRERTPVPGRQPAVAARRGGSGASPMPSAAASLMALSPEGAHPETTGKHPTDAPAEAEAQVVHLHPAGGPASEPAQPAEAAQATGPSTGSEPLPAPTSSAVRPAQRDATPTGGAQSSTPYAPPRPPVLASESLREDMEPTEPWRRALRVGGTGLAATGATACVALGGIMDLGVLGTALLLAGAAAACLAPLPYALRAWTVLGLSVAALATATTLRYVGGAPAEAPVLAPAIVVLAAGLLFRSAYRGSHLARTVVATGMLAVAVALVVADAVGELSQVGLAWQSWLHLASAGGFGLLLLVSLLAFMSPSTTGGTLAWSVCVLVWYGVHMSVTVVQRLFPEAGGPVAVDLPDPMAGLTAAAAAAAALAAIALAQALAVFTRSSSPRP
jgi:hypothetical protein